MTAAFSLKLLTEICSKCLITTKLFHLPTSQVLKKSCVSGRQDLIVLIHKIIFVVEML